MSKGQPPITDWEFVKYVAEKYKLYPKEIGEVFSLINYDTIYRKIKHDGNWKIPMLKKGERLKVRQEFITSVKRKNKKDLQYYTSEFLMSEYEENENKSDISDKLDSVSDITREKLLDLIRDKAYKLISHKSIERNRIGNDLAKTFFTFCEEKEIRENTKLYAKYEDDSCDVG